MEESCSSHTALVWVFTCLMLSVLFCCCIYYGKVKLGTICLCHPVLSYMIFKDGIVYNALEAKERNFPLKADFHEANNLRRIYFLHFDWLEKFDSQRNISLRRKVRMISTFSWRNISLQAYYSPRGNP